MPRKYPPLTPDQVRAILHRLGFTRDRTEGSHELWERAEAHEKRRLVTVDAAISEFGPNLMMSMIIQAGVTREAFYGATRATAAKINVKWRR